MSLWRVLRGLLPWGLVAGQGWIVDRLLRQYGRMLLEQEQVREHLENVEQMLRYVEQHRALSRTGLSEPSEATAGAGHAAASSHADLIRTRQHAHYHRLQDAARASTPPYPADRFSGAGIVIVAGGPEHFTNAWVCLTVLRQVLHCQLPIQIWYLGPHEMSPHMIQLLQRFDVECVDVRAVLRHYPARITGGWGCKPYAILHSRFKEVILLDADNVPLIDPAELLTRPEYEATGALFWPDLRNLGRGNEIWDICRVEYRDEPELESGQIVVDKARCWDALQLTVHINEYSDFYYQHVNGDKETFHMAWRMLNQPFSMPPSRPEWVTGLVSPGDTNFADVLLQHDFDGQVIFHHRTGAKWSAWGKNLHVPGFAYETVCLDALQTLRGLWDGRVDMQEAIAAAPEAQAPLLCARYFLYRLLGSDERVLEILPGGIIGGNRTEWEQAWRFGDDHGDHTLIIDGRIGATCKLTLDPDGVWRGRWIHQQQTPVELWPLSGVGIASDAAIREGSVAPGPQ